MKFGRLILLVEFNFPKKKMKSERIRSNFIKNLKSGKQTVFVTEDLQLTLYELFDFLETKNDLKPIGSGIEGRVFKFGNVDHGFAFIVKVLNIPNETEFFFNRWLSEEVSEKEKSTAFPFYIASRKNMIAIEFIEHMSLYPNYLFRNLISEQEQKDVMNYFYPYKSMVNASDITPLKRDLYIKSIFIQIIHGLYLIQGVNLHGFRHNDLHGQNVLVRKRTQKESHTLTFFSLNSLLDIVLPDFGIEAVISDFGKSSYPGIGKTNQLTYPLGDNNMYEDVRRFLVPWIDTFKTLRWNLLAKDAEDLLSLFQQTEWKFPSFDSILQTNMFRGAFKVGLSKKNPKDMHVALLPGTKRFTETKMIVDTWMNDTMPLELLNIRNNDKVTPSDIDIFIRLMERHLKISKSFTVLMNTENGFRTLVRLVPVSNYYAFEEIMRDHLLSDFSRLNLDELLKYLEDYKLGLAQYMLAFAIKNNILE